MEAILAGTNKQFTTLELVDGDSAGILAALGLAQPSVVSRLVLAPTAAALEADLDAKAARLGIVRATDVGPSVRALGWGTLSLFGVARVKSLTDWPLQASLPETASAATFDPSQTWTIAAAGDVMLDRFVSGRVERLSPEAPIPILHFQSEKFMLGGAANVARNIAALAGEAVLVGVLGEDEHGDQHQARSAGGRGPALAHQDDARDDDA